MIKKRIEQERELRDIRNPERIIQRAVKGKQKDISKDTKIIAFKMDVTIECCGKRHRVKKVLDQTKEVFSCKKCGAMIALSFWRTIIPKVIRDADANRRDEETGSPVEEGDSRGESPQVESGKEGSPRSEDEVKED